MSLEAKVFLTIIHHVTLLSDRKKLTANGDRMHGYTFPRPLRNDISWRSCQSLSAYRHIH